MFALGLHCEAIAALIFSGGDCQTGSEEMSHLYERQVMYGRQRYDMAAIIFLA